MPLAIHKKGALAPFLMAACAPNLRDEALLERSLAAFQSAHWADALLDAESVCRRHPRKTIPAVLRAKILKTAQPALAMKAWFLAWCRAPRDAMLQDAMLHAFVEAGALATVRELAPAFLPERCRTGQHVALLALLQAAGALPVGACWKVGDTMHGQLFFPKEQPSGRARLQVSDEDAVYFLDVPADGSRFAIPCPKPQGVWSLALCAAEYPAEPLLLSGSPLVFAERPVVDTVPAHSGQSPVGGPGASSKVHIVIPVYGNLALVQACIGSVLASVAVNTTPVSVMVVDDASPDAVLSAWLEQLAAEGLISLLKNRCNLGYIESCNRAMRGRQGHDVLVLNADTMVHGNWVDRLCTALYRAPDIASVTPWSNNGEISSFPRAAYAAPMPSAAQLAQIDGVAAALHNSGQTGDVDVPACCGFAMLMRGSVLDQIGLLDGESLIRGYNEEVDWCQRAVVAGYRHCLASGVFVAHAGTASFGYEKTLRVAQNQAVVQARYPHYYDQYQNFLQQDPLATARSALRLALESACQVWLAMAQGAVARSDAMPSFLPPSLSSSCARIAVWRYAPTSPAASKVLCLARRIASLPAESPRVRLLVLGEASEALWRTGVVDVLPLASKLDSGFLNDASLIGLCACKVILTETDHLAPAGTELVVLNKLFDPVVWLDQWLEQEMEMA